MPELLQSVLARRRNQEYLNDDNYIKQRVLAQTQDFINRFSGETSTKKADIPSNLKQKFNELYEDWLSSIQSIISANYTDEQALTKSFEIIKKFNNMVSYLNNIIKINNVSDNDVDQMKDKFNQSLPFLQRLVVLSTERNFIDLSEITQMYHEINNKTYNLIEPKRSSILKNDINLQQLNNIYEFCENQLTTTIPQFPTFNI